LKEDPKKEGMLYLGLDNSLLISIDDGLHWMPLKNNLPPAPIYWLEVQENFDDLVVSTYGRGYYILDDLSALRQFNPALKESPQVFDPRKSYRLNNKESIKTDGYSFNSGRNPAYGTPINYYLPDTLTKKVSIEIRDEKNQIIRTLKGSNEIGVNRVMWDLRYEPTYKPQLRTRPTGRPWVQLNGEGWRPLVTWDLDLWSGQYGPRVVPGKYKAVITIDDASFEKDLVVLKDPLAQGSLADLEAQVQFSLALREAMNVAVTMINKIEYIRSELLLLKTSLKKNSELKQVDRLMGIATQIAGSLYDIHLTGAREDAFRSPMKLYGRLSALASEINSSGIDFKPTDQQGAVYEVLNQRLQKTKGAFDELINHDIAAFNKQLNDLDMHIDIEKKMEKSN